MDAISKNGYLKYGFTEHFKSEQPHALFHIGLGELRRPAQTFLEECKNAAREIFNNAAGKNIFVALSGGIDSECVLQSFVQAKIPVQAAILQFENDLNWHDVDPALEICKKLNVPYTLVKLNVAEFLKQELHLTYAKDYKLSSPMIATHLWLAEYILDNYNGVPIFSGDFVTVSTSSSNGVTDHPVPLNPDYFYASPDWNFGSFGNQNHFAMDLLFQNRHCLGVANFFIYAVEQVAASIQIGADKKFSDQIRSLSHKPSQNPTAEDFYHGQVTTNKIKEIFFALAGFKISPRYSKWTGFELVHEAETMIDRNIEGRRLDPTKNLNTKLDGLVLFNERFRKPMKDIAQQILLKKIILHRSLYEFIKCILNTN